MVKSLPIVFFLFLCSFAFAQARGFEKYNTVVSDTFIRHDIRLLRELQKQDSADVVYIFSYSNEVTQEGIDKTIEELFNILEVNEIDAMNPDSVVSTFPEQVDPFDSKAIIKYLTKKKRVFDLYYLLSDQDGSSSFSWLLRYSLVADAVSIQCSKIEIPFKPKRK